MTEISVENQTIARMIMSAFSRKPKITEFWDDNRKSHVDILKCIDSPQAGVTSYSTIGLSDVPLLKEGKEYEVRLEIVGACGSNFTGFDNALSTAAFCIMNSKWFCFPGAIFPDILAMYECSSTMQHLLFTPPFLWEDKLETLNLTTKTVAWLMAVPISEAEYEFAKSEGTDKLVEIFEQEQIDVFDLERSSVL